MISFIKESDEVFYSGDKISYISNEEIEYLKHLAGLNPRKRIRLCAHKGKNDTLHEMFIVHKQGCYVTPHKHIGKVESMAIIEGEVDVILFENDGNIKKIIQMGDRNSGKNFYQRIADPIYHSMIIRSEFLVFHEITEGPFLREKTIFAPWAPPIENSYEIENFIQNIEMKIIQERKYE